MKMKRVGVDHEEPLSPATALADSRLEYIVLESIEDICQFNGMRSWVQEVLLLKLPLRTKRNRNEAKDA